jgi:hypothetical protein
MNKEQREEAKEVREKGACLRCYVLKLKVLDLCIMHMMWCPTALLVLQRISLRHLQNSVRTRSWVEDLEMEGVH